MRDLFVIIISLALSVTLGGCQVKIDNPIKYERKG